MERDELKAIGRELYGGHGWQTQMAKELQVDGSTVRRWISGASCIPGPAAVALRLLRDEHRRTAGRRGQENIA